MNTRQSILKRNVESVLERIEAAASRANRSRDEITLVAVTKYVDSDVVLDLASTGIQTFGESRPQVLWDKFERLQDEKFEWHLIGHLQRNKVKRTLPMVSMIHSVDSLRLLAEIEKEARAAATRISVLLEFNISGDVAKHGISDTDLDAMVGLSIESPAVEIVGLMGMGGLASSEAETRQQFAELRNRRDAMAARFPDELDLKFLSMGMSGDFEWAIEEGATHVRIGSVLFDGIR